MALGQGAVGEIVSGYAYVAITVYVRMFVVFAFAKALKISVLDDEDSDGEPPATSTN